MPSQIPRGKPSVAYVLKRYPRYSETFIVNEILAHEAAGLDVHIYSLILPQDDYIQDSIALVKAPVTYFAVDNLKTGEFWSVLNEVDAMLPDLWTKLRIGRDEDVIPVYQALLLAKEICTKGIDYIHSHFANEATTVARMAAHFTNVPFSFTAHAKDIFHDSVKIDHLKSKLRDAAAVITVSDYNVRYLREVCGDADGKVRCIYNGVDLNRFTFDLSRERTGEVLAVGRLIEKKGFEDLIEACAVLNSRGLTFHCAIIGTGPLESGLRNQINSLGLCNRVRLAGPLPQKEVVHYLRRAAVVVVPCVIGRDGNRDGLPTVILEAMASGSPCVSTDVTGIPEVIRNGETGFMVPQHSPAALADAIQKLLSDPEESDRIRKNARRLIEERFNIHRNTIDLRSVFINAIHNNKNRTGS